MTNLRYWGLIHWKKAYLDVVVKPPYCCSILCVRKNFKCLNLRRISIQKMCARNLLLFTFCLVDSIHTSERVYIPCLVVTSCHWFPLPPCFFSFLNFMLWSSTAHFLNETILIVIVMVVVFRLLEPISYKLPAIWNVMTMSTCTFQPPFKLFYIHIYMIYMLKVKYGHGRFLPFVIRLVYRTPMYSSFEPVIITVWGNQFTYLGSSQRPSLSRPTLGVAQLVKC